jgi:hypothetical protein
VTLAAIARAARSTVPRLDASLVQVEYSAGPNNLSFPPNQRGRCSGVIVSYYADATPATAGWALGLQRRYGSDRITIVVYPSGGLVD